MIGLIILILPEVSSAGFIQQNCVVNLNLTLSAYFCGVWDCAYMT